MCGTSADALRDANPDLDDRALKSDALIRIPLCERWMRYTVVHGDTLYAVARRFMVGVEEIETASNLQTEMLEVGQILVIPRLPEALPATAPAAAVAAAVPSQTTSAISSTPPAMAVSSPSNPQNGPRWMEVRLKDGRRAWAPTGGTIVESGTPAPPQRIVEIARQFVGAPYRWGGETPNGADCSGFVEEVFRLGGHHLPRTADVQFQATQPVANEQMQPGDLVFFSTYEPGPSHVGIFVGDGRFIHASSSKGVTESRLDEDYYARRYLGARRLPEWVQAGAAPTVAQP